MSAPARVNDHVSNQTTQTTERVPVHFQKSLPATSAAGTPSSYWLGGNMPAAGSSPATGKTARNCTKALTGSMLYDNPSAGKSLYLAGGYGYGNTGNGITGFVYVYHRMVDCNIAHNEASGNFTGLDATAWLGSTAGQGDGCDALLFTSTTLGIASNPFVLGYTNQNGVGSRVTPTLNTVASQAAGKSALGNVLKVPVQNGDHSIRSIESITQGGSNAVGTINIVLARLLLRIPILTLSMPFDRDKVFDHNPFPQIPNDACIMLVAVPASANTCTINGELFFEEN